MDIMDKAMYYSVWSCYIYSTPNRLMYLLATVFQPLFGSFNPYILLEVIQELSTLFNKTSVAKCLYQTIQKHQYFLCTPYSKSNMIPFNLLLTQLQLKPARSTLKGIKVNKETDEERLLMGGGLLGLFPILDLNVSGIEMLFNLKVKGSNLAQETVECSFLLLFVF